MPKKPKLTGTEAVQDFFDAVDHPLKSAMEEIRKIVMATDVKIGEQIKWNVPAFYYTGEMKPFDPKEYKRDILVFNLRKNDMILLVFPTGARIRDESGILEGNYPDGRRMVTFHSLQEVQQSAKKLRQVIKTWLSGVEK